MQWPTARQPHKASQCEQGKASKASKAIKATSASPFHRRRHLLLARHQEEQRTETRERTNEQASKYYEIYLGGTVCSGELRRLLLQRLCRRRPDDAAAGEIYCYCSHKQK